MPLNRRQFIKIGAALTVALSGAAALELSTWWDAPADAPFSLLNSTEAITVNAIGGAAFPSGEIIALNGSDASLDRFFDHVLIAMTQEKQHLLKLLLETIEHFPLVTHGQYFSKLQVSDQQHLIEGWLQSDHHLLRGAIQSLIILLSMGYTAHPTASKKLSSYFRCGFGA